MTCTNLYVNSFWSGGGGHEGLAAAGSQREGRPGDGRQISSNLHAAVEAGEAAPGSVLFSV